MPLGYIEREDYGVKRLWLGQYNAPGGNPKAPAICCFDNSKWHPVINGYLQVNNNPPGQDD